MSLEWYYRVEPLVRTSLPDICESFDDYDVIFESITSTKHPSFQFFIVFDDEETALFCSIHFDPINQEFYSLYYDEESEYEVKVLMHDVQDILDYIHTAFHEVLDEIEDMEDIENFEDDIIDDLTVEENFEDELTDESIEWISNDKYIHVESHTNDKHTQDNIHYKLGFVRDTGDGVLYRKTITSIEDEEVEEEVIFYFKEEEANYLIELLNDYKKVQS
ncbi:hypothetical protein EJF36_10345 [Bacillus sp. HMF5848]|uniref:hypothetical protein n=1 Tax=Bacillus sp. HMF5848 TaxID=2495421 RepID=UPI000F7AE108|nr:hypothetical protein [Bacillus sp. HMF5848]RSK27247.1 hypothetical protein EJF36_10345 [Bacillus sp. HMF5848]